MNETTDLRCRSPRSRPRRANVLACAWVALILAAPSLAPHALAQAFPTKPIRFIVPYPPGGGNDILARAVALRLSERFGHQVIVDNRGGGGGIVGVELATRSPADGYTMLLGSIGNLAFYPALNPKLPYAPLRDLAPIALVATSTFVLVVNPGVPAKSVSELIALAKAKPGQLNYASAGTGSSLHLTAEVFKLATGTDIVHVAYKGTAPALTDLIGGQVQVSFSTLPPALPHVKSGKLRALGTSGVKRARAAPDVPTIAEAGVPGFEVLNWYGMLLPAGTPAAPVRALNGALNELLPGRDLTDALNAQGLEPAGGPPERLTQMIRSEIATYAKVVKAANMRVE